MKKTFKLIIIALIMMLPCINVWAAGDPPCGPGDFWDMFNPAAGSNVLSIGGHFAYDIDQAHMSGTKLELHGWALNTGADNNTSTVELRLKPQGSGTAIDFTVSYPSPALSGLNLKYWTCSRTPYQPGVTGGECIASSMHNQTRSFVATVDLANITTTGKYVVEMKWNGPGLAGGGWKPVNVVENVSQDLLSFNDNGQYKVKISGFATKGIVTPTRPLGSSGYYCDAASGSTNAERASASISGTKTLQGPSIKRQNVAGDSINLYPVSYTNGNTVYVPATDIELANDSNTGLTITAEEKSSSTTTPGSSSGSTSNPNPGSGTSTSVSTGTIGTVSVPTETVSGACDGQDIYWFHYLFIDEITASIGNHHTEAKQMKYGDEEILQALQIDSLADITIASEGYATVTKDGDSNGTYSLSWFTQHAQAADLNTASKYENVGNDYYITHKEWCNQDGTCQPSVWNIDWGNFSNTAVKADVTITKSTSSTSKGYEFDVNRDYNGNTMASKQLISTGSAPSATNNKLYQPSVYSISFCKKSNSEPPSCDDDVNQAVCTDGGGTEAHFYENKDLKKCTLQKGTHSGFTIVEKDDTTPPIGNSFGTVACKEDLDFYLPGGKSTAAGQYFLLDNNIPAIKANRTCITSAIKYDDFDNNLKNNYEDKLPKLYNSSKAYSAISNNFPNLVTTQNPTSCIDAAGNVHNYVETLWYIPEIPDSSIPNASSTGIHFPGVNTPTNPGSYVPGGTPCGGPEGDNPQDVYDQQKQDAKQKAEDAVKEYNDTLKNYSETIKAYNELFRWTEDVENAQYNGGGSGQFASISKASVAKDNTQYSFKPKVTFNYSDKDGHVFPVPYTYPNGQESPSESKKYWGTNAEPDNQYNGGGGSLTKQSRKIINCAQAGDTCTANDAIEFNFITNGAIRRDEKIEYEYHLPTVYTNIPSGTVTSSMPSGAHLTLDPEAVPVNINTLAGTYEYTIEVKELKDAFRKSKYSNNSDDDWGDDPPSIGDTRFSKLNVLNTGNVYTCHYKVVNDIYLPNPGKERFNFFYRIVEPANINPNNRALGYNWTDGRGDVVQGRMRDREENYQQLTNSSDTDKFVFTLTPSVMKDIRTYNSKKLGSSGKGYADWDLTCNDYDSPQGYHCFSNFLGCLVEEPQGNCGEVLESTLNSSKYTTFESKRSNYTFTDLQNNRNLLISKQNSIDGKGVTTP